MKPMYFLQGFLKTISVSFYWIVPRAKCLETADWEYSNWKKCFFYILNRALSRCIIKAMNNLIRIKISVNIYTHK